MKLSNFLHLILLSALIACNRQPEHNSNSPSEKVEDVELPCADYAVYKYDSSLQTDILTYQYTDLWDIDGDSSMDSIAFIGNGGAHQYFHLEINLSSESKWMKFEYLKIDMPYISDSLEIIEMDSLYPQFAVFDIDDDNIDEIYINISDPTFHWHVPLQLSTKGIFSQRIILDYRENQLHLEEYLMERQISNPNWPHWSEEMNPSDIELR